MIALFLKMSEIFWDGEGVKETWVLYVMSAWYKSSALSTTLCFFVSGAEHPCCFCIKKKR